MRIHKLVLLGAVVAVAIAAGARIDAQAKRGKLTQTAYLKASNPHMGDHFGNGGTLLGDSVALSGDGLTLAVGAPNESSGSKGINGNENDTSVYSAGAVYVYTRRNATSPWAQQAYVKASNPQNAAEFGHAVALSADGSTMVVGAYHEASAAKGINGNQSDTSIMNAGAAYIFARRGTTWTQQAYVKASNTGEAGTADSFSEGDQFGFSVAISDDGNTVAAGANTEDSKATGINGDESDNSAQSAGAVYVFVRSGATWTQQAYVKPAATPGNAQFGYSVALSANGSTLAAGSFDEPGASHKINGDYAARVQGGGGGTGAVFVFTRTGTSWTQQAYLKADNGENGDSMGVATQISDDGNTVLTGSLDEDCMATGVNPAMPCNNDVKNDTSAGAAYVFVRSGATWTQQAFIKASNTGKEDWFGSRLALSGDGNTAAIAAQLEDSAGRGVNGKQDDDSAQEAGAVYFFTRTGTTWAQQAYVKSTNNEAFDEFGSSVSLSRDGKTLAAGAREEASAAKGINGNQQDNSMKEAGAAYIFRYDPAAPSGTK